jgi:hypothetical protein
MRRRVGIERIFLAWAAACLLSLFIAGTLGVLVGIGGGPRTVGATLLVAAAALALSAGRRRVLVVTGTPVVAAALAVALGTPAEIPAHLVVMLGAAVPYAPARTMLAPRLPVRLDALARGRQRQAIVWAIVLVGCILQIARLGAYLQDPSFRAGAALPLAPAHQCLPAYLRGAELALQGSADLYDPLQYQPTATSIEGMRASMRDPFQYPPPALLLPAAALAVTRDFRLLGGAWLALQVLAFVAVAVVVARRVGKPAAALLSALLLGSLPVLSSLEYGQAHLFTLSLSMAAMLAFEKGHSGLGGLLLSSAIVVKVFPALLLVYLLMRWRLRPLVATLLACAGWIAVTELWFGSAPFIAFFGEQLPRLASGSAFATFAERADFDVVHMGVPGIALALEQAGLAGARAWSGALALGYGALVLALLWISRKRASHPIAWLAVLTLASGAASFVPAVYGVLAPLWLATLAIATSWPRREGWLVIAAALTLCVAPFAGNLPLFWSIPGAGWKASLACAGIAVALALAAMAGRFTAARPAPATSRRLALASALVAAGTHQPSVRTRQ